MVLFPTAKINIGLFVTGKRPDGFHNLESIFYPVPFQDVLEILLPGDLPLGMRWGHDDARAHHRVHLVSRFGSANRCLTAQKVYISLGHVFQREYLRPAHLWRLPGGAVFH